MDCATARKRIEEKADGLLPTAAAPELDTHLAGCAACAADRARTDAVGPLLRSYAAAQGVSAAPRLDAMWTRVRAGIGERQREARASRVRRWLWLPAAALLVVFTLLFYPTRADRPPFNPSAFDVSFEYVESDTASVALVNKGEGLPRVIWIIEDAKSPS